jgi:hypothetical protein
MLAFGLIAVPTNVEGQVPDSQVPDKKKPKVEKPSKHDRGRTHKVDHEKIKERLKAAWDKRKKTRGDAKKKGHKVHRKGSAFGKLVRDDAKIKELKEAFAAVAKKGRKGFDRKAWKDATDDEKKALREKMSAGRKEWYEKMKTHREEVGKRIKEIRKEFKNNRDKVIDGNDPGE